MKSSKLIPINGTHITILGFEVVHASHLTPAMKVPHPNLGSDVNPTELYEWVRKHAPSNVEGVFLAGNGLRPIGVITALEEDLGRPVLTANQVAFWYALRLAGVGAQVVLAGVQKNW